MAMLEAKTEVEASTDVFETGKYKVTTITVTISHPTQPPVPLIIVAPLTQDKLYPVLLFCHGYMIWNTMYTDLLRHIASHGYIVVAPQLYGIFGTSGPEEVKRAAKVREWLSTGLPDVLPEKVNPDMDKLALSGHSRGGKTAFTLALGKFDGKASVRVRDDTPVQPKFKALIGIDPVAGTSISNQLDPKILEYKPCCFDMPIPVAVIGTGLGNQRKFWMIPPCAPDGVNHKEFFNECKPPACYFVAKEYGHNDILDENLLTYFLRMCCKSGDGSKQLMRNGVGGIVVAFLRYYLGHDQQADLNLILNHPAIAPILLDPVIDKK